MYQRGLFFGQHIRDGVLTVMTDGDMQLHPRIILKRETRLSTVFRRFRNREILPSGFVEWEEGLVRGLLDGPSNCEEPEPLLSHDRVYVSLGDGNWDRGG